jgi:O-antigen/teichoic acid export membrane protein
MQAHINIITLIHKGPGMRKIVTMLIAFIVAASLFSPAYAGDALRVFYAGEDGAVKTALRLAPAGTFTLVSDPAQADVFVLNTSSALVDVDQIAARVKAGAGLVLIPGADMDAQTAANLLGIPVTLNLKNDPVSLTEIKIDDTLVKEIIWNSAPQVRERFETQTPLSSVQPLVTAFESGEWLLWQARPHVFVFNAVLSGGANPQIQEWGYFNYLIYHLVMRAGGKTPLSFAEYPASPVPHASDRNILMTAMALLVLITFAAFFVVRRYSLAHPEALDQIVSDRGAFETKEAATEWEIVGFHRPLGGFLVALSMGLVLFIPLIIYQNLILPTYILPSAQALGIWGRVTQFFALAWQFFDMGTSIAFIKYLSEYRVRDPKKGIQYGQVFVWWQLLSGSIQVAIVIALASIWAPGSAYALYAWSVIIHAFIQLPGFYQVFKHALSGFQRGDYSRMLEIGLNLVLPILVQPIFVSLMFAWGRAHPVFGGAMGGLLGLGMAAYAAELLTFIWGFWLYRHIGYNVRVLFLAHFDWDVVKSSFKFGVFEMLGSAAWAGGQAAEIAITQTRLINYAEIWGNWGLAQNFVFAFSVVATLGDSVMPAISEAVSSGKKVLAQYYAVMFYKYGGLVSGFVAAVLLAVADRFIIGSTGVEFERAAVYVIPLTIWGALQYPSWVGDQVQLGSNKPYLKSILVFSEQFIRVVLALLLLARLQVTALIIAYLAALITKGVTTYFVNNRFCYPQKFYFWQGMFAPLLASATHYAVLRWLTGLIWKGDQLTSVLIFFLAILPSFPLYNLFYSLFGGWDQATLDELKAAVDITGSFRWLANLLIYYPARFGARFSPLTGRFPITIRAAAMQEAAQLTHEKVKL